ncbi:winged helix-turn-helix transcriptional regulator [candidate division KSB1 bacterium]|nr:winged helix-turn-helix transcriptional regulator [candidate division KSB1 bacterium]
MIEKRGKRLAEVAPKIMGAFHELGRHHPDHKESLTMRQYQALIIVNAFETLSISDFCTKLNLAASTGTELANRMIALGYFSKGSDSPDKRQVLLTVTKRGIEVLNKRHDDLTDLFVKFIAPFSEQDQIEFVNCFEKIWELIHKNRSNRSSHK